MMARKHENYEELHHDILTVERIEESSVEKIGMKSRPRSTDEKQIELEGESKLL